jgi:hypothetical protein
VEGGGGGSTLSHPFSHFFTMGSNFHNVSIYFPVTLSFLNKYKKVFRNAAEQSKQPYIVADPDPSITKKP